MSAVGRPAGWQFGMVEKAVMRDETIPRNVKLLYAYLTIWCGEERSAFPGRARIARELGLSLSALDEAKKIGQDIGLWKIENRPDPENPKLKATNKYWLNDQGGSYIPGSGTGARAKGKPRGRSAQRSPEQGVGQILGDPLSQNLADPPPKSGQYQDQLSRPASIKTNASSVDAPAGAHEQARGRANDQPTKRIHIDMPTAVDAKELTRRLVAASTAAMKKAGQPLGSQGRADIGAWVKDRVDTLTVDGLATALEEALQAGLAGDTVYSWLFEDLDKPVSYPNTDDGFEQLHDDYDGFPGATATIDSMWPDGYHPNTIAATINKQLSA